MKNRAGDGILCAAQAAEQKTGIKGVCPLKTKRIVTLICVAVAVLALAVTAVVMLNRLNKRVFGVSSIENNTVLLYGDRAPKQSAGIGYLTVAPGDTVVITPNSRLEGSVRIRFMAGLLGSVNFPDTPSAEVVLEGDGNTELALSPGEYTLGAMVERTFTGSAAIFTRGAE